MPSKENPQGYVCLVLHAHLPFVRHPEYADCLEERWLFEAITETYIPLIDVLQGLQRDGVDFRLTMSITPPLCSMLSDPLLQDRYLRGLELLIELAELEVERTRWMNDFRDTAVMYLRKFRRCREIFVDSCGGKILKAFRELQDSGKLEIITCGATHGFMPLMQVNPQAVKAQISIATTHYQECFGRSAPGIWNGECGYFPGLEQYLAEEGLRYFFVDAHGILYANNRPKYGVYAPVYCPNGMAAFGRDLESSQAVWSAEQGYPGDFRYREFYRDIGYDLDFDYIKPYLHESGLRVSTGIKYHKVTAAKVDLADKQPYGEADALEAAAEHAGNFVFNRVQQIDWLGGAMDRPPIVVCPYDAELFGHWWYEGPEFLNYVFRKMHFDQQTVGLITPTEYLERFPQNQVLTPTMSSWGVNGYNEVWLDESNDWIYRHLIKAAERMTELARQFSAPNELTRRALNQAVRELLLAQSSDWAFIMKTRTMVDYACERTRRHLGNFTELYQQLHQGQLDAEYLAGLEQANNIFPKLNYQVYA